MALRVATRNVELSRERECSYLQQAIVWLDGVTVLGLGVSLNEDV